jgi:hypothetical protein
VILILKTGRCLWSSSIWTSTSPRFFPRNKWLMPLPACPLSVSHSTHLLAELHLRTSLQAIFAAMQNSSSLAFITCTATISFIATSKVISPLRPSRIPHPTSLSLSLSLCLSLCLSLSLSLSHSLVSLLSRFQGQIFSSVEIIN